ncbi:MAG: holo-ACP synthase [Sphaerochaeta sp.]|jgi:holo-[acyl-carrier protein] synthase|uniref:holo-ACP synthase n=1 Tax=Sphaerochaeta sp. TaxID=1972642 RepID=UPI002FC7E841
MALAIGIDVVNIERIARLSDAVRNRMFHPQEIEDSLGLGEERQAEFLAGRFAAKEALGKALGTGLRNLRLQDIWVERGPYGEPVMRVQAKAEEMVAHRTILLSISHDKPVAVAMVVLTGGSDGPF